ncbi:MAG TPA: N-acetyl-lysine deacetylase [Candidatus Caldiarchaeum subterraneum]|uniref:Putative [LysW]-lysine/[LysW]-ornithine hydrolase n=1 Tax=Caldiarchaeum subterraneum TaxID=311458 RepID=A0A832ZVX8_CALS0|nr:N-acetyl-lysine deacetylase [Aigarchaeota archaeon]HIQ29683.1 N-acetyl-lysine deacetylase [Candidatus Caldarchaeum subterraneum]
MTIQIEQEQVISILIQLLEIHTPPGEERRLEHTWNRICRSLQYPRYWRDENSSYFASYGDGGRTIMLASHVDTVPGELPVKVVENRVFGRGAVDAKSSVACMLIGAALARERVRDVRVVVAGLADEEGRGRGAKRLVERGFKADYIIIGEPTGLTGIATSYRGSLTLKVEAKARGGHSSAPYMAESALERILTLWSYVKEEFGGSRYEEVTSALTTLHSGDWPSKMPDKAEATINIRFPNPYTSSQILESLRKRAEETGCVVKVIDATEPVETSISTRTARALSRSMLRIGLKPRIVKKTGTSDMNTLYNITRDIVACGPGNSLLAHTDEENITVEELMDAVKVYAGAVEELARTQ